MRYLFGFLLLGSHCFACSAFKVQNTNGNFRIGRSFDWYFFLTHGEAMINGRDVKKKAFNSKDKKNPAQWTSKYGSVSFTQFGRDLPLGGMNEQGLVVEILQMDGTKYDSTADRPFVNESQWVQYVLDQAKDLKEVVSLTKKIRIDSDFVGVHYFVCDQKANCAVLEYKNGEAIFYSGDQLPVPAVTNSFYSEYDKKNLNKRDWYRTSEARFETLNFDLNQKSVSANLDEHVFDILEDVRSRGWVHDALLAKTLWQISYDPKLLQIEFKTRLHPKLQTISLAKLDFSCKKHGMGFDMNEFSKIPTEEKFKRISDSFAMELLDQNKEALPKELLKKGHAFVTEEVQCAPSASISRL